MRPLHLKPLALTYPLYFLPKPRKIIVVLAISSISILL
jgi:hypothetical protein